MNLKTAATPPPALSAPGQLLFLGSKLTGWAGALLRTCSNCGAGEPKIVAAILERPVIQKIPDHLGLDPQPPPKGRAREPGLRFAA